MNFIGHNRSRWKLKGLSRIIHVLATLRGEFWCWVDNKTKNVYVHIFKSHVTGIVFLTVMSLPLTRRDKSAQYYTNIITLPFWPYSVWLSMSIELFGLPGKTRLSFPPSIYTNIFFMTGNGEKNKWYKYNNITLNAPHQTRFHHRITLQCELNWTKI